MNFQVGRTIIIDYRDDASPVEIQIGWETGVLLEKKNKVNAIKACYYWLDSPAIALRESNSVRYINDDTIQLRGEFSRGYFGGNLLHHDAAIWGDCEFQIGLMSLLTYGNTPKTARGQRLIGIGITPLYIRFVYNEKVVTQKTKGIHFVVYVE